MAVTVKKIIKHGRFVDTMPVYNKIVQCPECRHLRVHGRDDDDAFKVENHTDGLPLFVITCPNCDCVFHIDVSKEGAR